MTDVVVLSSSGVRDIVLTVEPQFSILDAMFTACLKTHESVLRCETSRWVMTGEGRMRLEREYADIDTDKVGVRAGRIARFWGVPIQVMG